MKFPRRSFITAALAAVLALGLASPATAAQAPKAAPIQLDAAAKADIARIEAYLNGITTMRTRFVQIAESGAPASGVLTISRPGRMRFEYDPPSPIMLIATGTFLIYIDQALGQATHVLLRNTPIGVLVAEDVKLSNAVTITDFQRNPGVLRVTLIRTSEPEEGSITLVFADAPLTLRQWIVIDAQGARTTVTLNDPQYGVSADPQLFRYEAPTKPARD